METGAGHPPEENAHRNQYYERRRRTEEEENEEEEWEDESDSDDDTLDQLTQIIQDASDAQEIRLKHKAVPVPKHRNPMNPQQFWVFEYALGELKGRNFVPPGYGLTPDEWEGGEYPTIETIKVGWKRQNNLYVPLSDEIWRPRAEQWARGLYIINSILSDSM